VPGHYSRIGEVNGNLTGLLGAAGVTAPFDVAADSAPVVYVHGQPARTAAQVRSLEQAAATLKGQDLVTGRTVRLTNYLADPVELKLLHMVTGGPQAHSLIGAVRQPALLAQQRQDELRLLLLHRDRRHRRLEPR
jgi:hypothetical protein